MEEHLLKAIEEASAAEGTEMLDEDGNVIVNEIENTISDENASDVNPSNTNESDETTNPSEGNDEATGATEPDENDENN